MHDGSAGPLHPEQRHTWGQRVAAYVGSAPVTFVWLTVLFSTTAVQHLLPRWHLFALLRKDSTNLHHLASEPIRVLITSLLWIDGFIWWPYLLVFCLVLAPAEHWLGSLRFVVAGLIAHVAATYLSEGFLYWQIQEAAVSPRYLNARDIGVSYFVVGVAALLGYRVVRPWRWLYLLTIIGCAVVAVFVAHPMFTQVGHLCAVFVGLACYPMARGRTAAALDPARLLRRLGAPAPPA
ncbi:rhomboid-like protein [Mycolicibacterium sp. CBM1]